MITVINFVYCSKLDISNVKWRMALKCGWPVIEKTSKTTAAYVSQSGSR